ncbi:transposase [Escherichia coli]|nr:transposase [Escherichia coli]
MFQKITQHITRNMPRVVILIDWSGYHSADFQLLRASLVCDGRSLPLMSYVVPLSQLGNPDIHARFLDSLSLCFSEKTEVIIISDAGFQGHWFRQIRSHGWMYVCRVPGAQYYKINEEWEKPPAHLFIWVMGCWDVTNEPGMKGIFIFIKAEQKDASLNVRKTEQPGQ